MKLSAAMKRKVNAKIGFVNQRIASRRLFMEPIDVE
jgi:hypothetical protein